MGVVSRWFANQAGEVGIIGKVRWGNDEVKHDDPHITMWQETSVGTGLGLSIFVV